MNRLIVGLTLCLVALLAWIVFMGRAPSEAGLGMKPAPTAAAATRPVSCLSYAPYRRPGDAPWHADRPITPEQIREDLLLLQPLTQCVRTYGVEHGLGAVPSIARELGFKVKLGVWIGGDREANERHLNRALALAREYRDVVDLLIVGNEVLLRRELSPPELAGLLERARAASVVPVTYAEVWEFWQRHAEILRPHVDLVAVHVLPYWEDDPVGIDEAVGHVQAVLRSVSERFAPLPVWLAETGWPAAGRQRGPALPGIQEQTRLVREWLEVAPAEYNLIEAFDQPWKRDLEGAMGGHWGVLDHLGQIKVTLKGPLPARVDPARLIGSGVAGGLFGMAFFWWLSRFGSMRGSPLDCGDRRPPALMNAGLCALMVGLLAGACLGPLALLQYEMIALWSRRPAEWALGSLYALTALFTTVAALHSALTGRQDSRLARMVVALMVLTLAQAFALLLDGRYRPLVWPLLLGPGIALLLVRASRTGEPMHPSPQGSSRTLKPIQAHPRTALRWLTRLCAGALLLSAGALVAIEGTENAQAVQAGLIWSLLAAGALACQEADPQIAGHVQSRSGT